MSAAIETLVLFSSRNMPFRRVKFKFIIIYLNYHKVNTTYKNITRYNKLDNYGGNDRKANKARNDHSP